MEKRKIDVDKEIGKRYGRLTVVGFSHYKQYRTRNCTPYVKCVCDCGNEKTICLYSLLYGLTQSCGCLVKDNNGKRTHGLSKTRLYNIYNDIKRRCNNSNRKEYHNYGGRGISMCEEWKSDFLKFYEWSLENGYQDNLSIDRIDVNGNYDPNNCRWTDAMTQANNKRVNHFVTYNGETHTLAEWSRIKNISSSCIRHRISCGWNLEEVFEDKEHQTKYASEVLYTIGNETHNVADWCRLRGLSKDTVRYRRDHGWTPEEIFGFKRR